MGNVNGCDNDERQGFRRKTAETWQDILGKVVDDDLADEITRNMIALAELVAECQLNAGRGGADV